MKSGPLTRPIPFVKMHGCGNDFVIIDGRHHARGLVLAPNDTRQICNRHTGIGCDQLIIVKDSIVADMRMFIHNADGSMSAACGNATRCVAYLEMQSRGKNQLSIETERGVLHAWCDDLDAPQPWISVDMQTPQLNWHDIPLSRETTILHVPINQDFLNDPVAVGMGNPHLIFFVEQPVESIDLASLAPSIQQHHLLPKQANITIAKISPATPTHDYTQIHVRTFERGSGETLACGSAACATVVAAHLRKYVSDRSQPLHIIAKGGTVSITWRNTDNHVLMSGPAVVSFTGVYEVSREQ